MFQSESQRLQFISWVVVLFLLMMTVVSYGGNGDDAYWHIKVGEWILAHRQVPSNGIFSYSNPNTPWVSHEWLSAVLMYKVFQLAHWPGLVFLAILSLFASMLLLLNFLLQRLNTVQSLIFILFAYLLLVAHVLPRPHILAIPIMIYWSTQLITASEKQTAPPLYLVPLMILWVNMHASFVLGIAFSVFFAAEAIFYAPPHKRKQLSSEWGIFIVAAVACTTITPHGVAGLLLPFQLNNQEYALSRISEWASANFHGFQPLELWLLSFLALVLTQGIKLPVFRLLFLLGLLHLSLKHIRHACDLLSVLSPLILAMPLAQHWQSKPEISFKQFLPKTYPAVLILILCFCGLYFYLAQIKVIEAMPNRQIQQVLQTLKPEQAQLGNVLNNYGIGDFLIYQNYAVFIDPRAELYGDKFMKSYFNAIELEESSVKLEKLLKQYHIGWTIFYTHEVINTYLATQPQWHKLYADKVMTIFINQSVILSLHTLTKLKMLETQAVAQQQKAIQENNLAASF